MRPAHHATFAACAALALGLAPAAHAQKPGESGVAASESITLRVCNNSYDPANVVISYQPVGQDAFYNEGWFTVNSGACSDLAETTNAYMYVYAEVVNDSSRFWSGDFPLCVEYPGPFAFWTDDDGYCEPGQDVRNFNTLHALGWGVYTFNLNPP